MQAPKQASKRGTNTVRLLTTRLLDLSKMQGGSLKFKECSFRRNLKPAPPDNGFKYTDKRFNNRYFIF
jgi:hypothetical protein